MIIRTWLILGTLIVVAAWVLTVPYSPPPYQAETGSFADTFRAENLLPKAGNLEMSEELEGVFEVPKTDAIHIAAAEAAMAAAGGQDAMPGMAMPGMDMAMPAKPTQDGSPPAMDMGQPMPKQPESMPGMTAPMAGQNAGKPMEAAPPAATDMKQQAQHLPAPMPGMTEEAHEKMTQAMPPPAAMNMGQEAPKHAASMPGMTMPEAQQPMQAAPMPPAMDMGKPAPDHQAPAPGMAMTMPGKPMPGMPAGGEDGEEGHKGGHGLMVVPAAMSGMATRTVNIEMGEWGFTPGRITVKPGEVIHFVVHNSGKLAHEFMFMPAIAMQALNYRIQRADWTLTEHEAIFEQEVVLPGDSLEVTLKVMEPGSWMFMCMFPYHMQFGMMGMMMSDGAAMPGMDMGNMKM